MEKQKRKQHTAEFKAKVVKEILKEEKTISQLSSEYGVHTSQLYKKCLRRDIAGLGPQQILLLPIVPVWKNRFITVFLLHFIVVPIRVQKESEFLLQTSILLS